MPTPTGATRDVLVIGPIDGVGVLGGGTAFPDSVLSNEEVLRELAPALWPSRGRLPSEEELTFLARGAELSMGVRSRAWAHRVGTPLDHQSEKTSLDLSVAAARAALTDAGVEPRELSLILCATSTPHRMTSTVSAALGCAIGARAACMDVRTGCSAGIFALATAGLYLSAGSGPVLLVGVDTFSKIIPPQSKLAALSLADGAGALVLGRRKGARLHSAALMTDGALGRLITTDGALPPTAEEISRGGYLLSGAPEELTAQVPGKYIEAIEAALSRAGLRPGEVDLFAPHQTSRPVISEVCHRSGLAPDRTFINVQEHANIGAAGWVVALVEARTAGRCPAGARVLVASVGGGMSWGAAVLTC